MNNFNFSNLKGCLYKAIEDVSVLNKERKSSSQLWAGRVVSLLSLLINESLTTRKICCSDNSAILYVPSYTQFFYLRSIQDILGQSIPRDEKEAARLILTTCGFVSEKEDCAEKKFQGTRGEIQGTFKLRQMTAAVTKYFHQSVTPSVLRLVKDCNLEQYLTFQIKRISHCFHLDGDVYSPWFNKISLEGFFEVTIPMIASSFKDFSQLNQNYFNSIDIEWLVHQFNQATTSEILSERDLEHLAKEIQRKDFEGPICMASGYDWHGTFTIFWKNYVLSCDRQGTDPYSGIVIYKLASRDLVTDSILHKIAVRQNHSSSNYFSRREFKNQLKAEILCYIPMSVQKKGHCMQTNAKAGLFALMGIRCLMKAIETDKIDLENLSTIKWFNYFMHIKYYYKAWSTFDSIEVLKEYFEDIEMALDLPSLNLTSRRLIGLYQQMNVKILKELKSIRKISNRESLSNELTLFQQKLQDKLKV